MNYFKNIEFNPDPPTIMHIDLNSCFASVEQQANHFLRNRPIAVAAYETDFACILAPSIEAKRYGIKTGMRVKEGKQLCPKLLIMEPDGDKYRYIHLKFRDLLSNYVENPIAKSIDEFVLDFRHSPRRKDMLDVGAEIKSRIKKEIGDYLTVSIGVSTNKFLAKTASNLKKPDGLEQITSHNHLDVFERLELRDLNGIGRKNELRLSRKGIESVMDLYRASGKDLQMAFHSVVGYYWYMALRGWESENYEHTRKSFSHQYTIGTPTNKKEELMPSLAKMTEKVAFRMRTAGYQAKGVFIAVRYHDQDGWHTYHNLQKPIFETVDLLNAYLKLLFSRELKKIRRVSLGVCNLMDLSELQPSLFTDVYKRKTLVNSVDDINTRWGMFTIASASMITKKEVFPDRIGFGRVGELKTESLIKPRSFN